MLLNSKRFWKMTRNGSFFCTNYNQACFVHEIFIEKYKMFLCNFLTVSIFASPTVGIYECHPVPTFLPLRSIWNAWEVNNLCPGQRPPVPTIELSTNHRPWNSTNQKPPFPCQLTVTTHHHFVSYLFCVGFRRLLKALFWDNVRLIISLVLVQVWGFFYHEREVSLLAFQ